MSKENITTLGQLKASGYKSKSIKDELRDNLITNIKAGKNSFEGIHGYEYTVIPELERAILSKHNINLLGLRGQAKTRLARLMVGLLDEFIPVVEGSEINDDPFNPISRTAVELIAEKGDDTPVSWLHRDERFAEKLATPDVTVADLIGDVDPIKAANLKLSYADDRVIHFGMIPRANRCIFVINELPDLQARIQVALFNILQEGDIQIRGFKLRMPLDVQFVFTANPEDYTNRGSIVTPLKDRIGSQILTHYPETVEIAKTITQQEAKADVRKDTVHVPEIAKNLLEELSFQARESEFVDIKSGISARISITAYENLLSTAERRMLLSGDGTTAVRFSDFMGVIPSITGKIELVYEGEQEGSAAVAMQLLSRATKQIFIEYFPKIEKLQKADDVDPYQNLVEWFFEESKFELLDNFANDEYKSQLDSIQPLQALIENHIDDDVNEDDLYFIKELVLWALVEYNKLSKYRMTNGMRFKDIYGGYISGL
ncbi:sigma 54-interacting transcriptional regulator [Croceibacter atlanticus]|jgi:magnesium chelatase subunit I|uniref:Magnesium protoporphyrin chelatase, putative n=1 Tax=Croceibacter atlanticus (strain ATCC BAA-628 / JCM 21780 / CIP 108009 / IAM 15332 / KCTC 12090 / HTCC2559) TaxID=216432 RepID=A3UBW8_CROAH|nr:sigma 54-interacting transcriptional regulator [Croceibacter atlanticus]EAP86119.1 magnesium protoporphyrin chelatase, putative [Croceibacter atlanticus HTCC2559]MBW4969019.1 sigma 54-interacting transcriptional regulator [Croceibacter atlanticus]